jgi:hypothetical protein
MLNNSIAQFYFIFLDKNKQNKQIKQTKRQCVFHTPNLNDTLSLICQEIQYHGMRKSECTMARASPKLEHQNTCQQLTSIFSHRNKHQKVNCCYKQKKNEKKKKLKYKVRKIKKKKYCTFLDHLGVQPIPSTISSLKFDIPLEGCSATSSSLVACF